jgi:hypothetical protein
MYACPSQSRGHAVCSLYVLMPGLTLPNQTVEPPRLGSGIPSGRLVYHQLPPKFKKPNRKAYTFDSDRYTDWYEWYASRFKWLAGEFAYVTIVFP